jgi:hypothetical protein
MGKKCLNQGDVFNGLGDRFLCSVLREHPPKFCTCQLEAGLLVVAALPLIQPTNQMFRKAGFPHI